ncbi:flagellar protein export ATPase FliI [Syntrophothermus lipocalidus]|uniref:Flagellar protein export ATPase FliI n=1 Tax=Syntrophothermus lipocalidus (strain DSM 12680 / TGB-C1) TaxID=643648 RepID=D7CM00_SYNLT|nr:flagellar protein export ATPase FliI [Syntrophothermus lipocalidus]ADI01735.1 flagellar protein export ATPase FliI [Syntrophothermus lipocalidus DSM 12680]
MGKVTTLDLDKYLKVLDKVNPLVFKGRISQVVGLTIESDGPRARMGELCLVRSPGRSDKPLRCEVVGFKGNKTLLMPLGELDGIGPGSEIVATGQTFKVRVGRSLVGRVLNGLGEPIDGGGPVETETTYPVMNHPPDPLKRRRITEVLPVGVRAIDALVTVGKGQRMGILAGSGVGKSTLLGMIARNTEADVSVIALIGERGREVRDFLERDLGEEGLKRSVVVVATSDQPALIRLRGAFVATSIAEFFRDQGLDVLLLMDSLTRFALAQREIGLAIGEPPATRGFTPSVFALLPKLLERAGASDKGTITGLYAVLVEGDDMNEPITDAVRGIVDGHIALTRELASLNHFPAIDVLGSISRVMPEIVSSSHLESAGRFRSLLAVYREAKDLVDIGAYRRGANPRIDEALELIDGCNAFLQQGVWEKASFNDTVLELEQVVTGQRQVR